MQHSRAPDSQSIAWMFIYGALLQNPIAWMSWSLKFDEPIALPKGKALRTLRDAGLYVTALSKTDQGKPHWQTAAHEPMMAAEHGGILMLAEIAMRQALHAGKPQAAPAPRKKAAKKYQLVR